MNVLDGVKADVCLSPDRTYRYMLSRRWSGVADQRQVVFVMLNPSTADADTDDRTVRKCQKYARSWGYSGVVIVNLFALRSKHPRALRGHPDPVGPVNDIIIEIYATAALTGLVVAAWGAEGQMMNRGLIVEAMLEGLDVDVMRLGPATRAGHPWHPLYRKDDVELERHRL